MFRNRRRAPAPAHHHTTLNLCPPSASPSHFSSLSRLQQSRDWPTTVVALRKRVVAVGRVVRPDRISHSRRRGTSLHNEPSLRLRPPLTQPHPCIVGYLEQLTSTRITTECWHFISLAAGSRFCSGGSGQAVAGGFCDRACVQDQGLISRRSNRGRPLGTTSRARRHLSSDFGQAGKVC